MAALLTVAELFWDDSVSPCVALGRSFPVLYLWVLQEGFSICCVFKRHIGRRSGDL